MAICSGGGNYNPYHQRCTCPIGRNGTYCEAFALPACRVRPASTAVSCAVRRPQHCECVRQCLASGAFAVHIFPVCFERTGESEPLSDVPSINSVRATFYQLDRRSLRKLKPLPADRALGVEFKETALVHVAHRHCPRRCSERGACVAERAWLTRRPQLLERAFCKCDGFYEGRACERHLPTLCYNNCSSRGVCLDGFCSCTPPFFGPSWGALAT